MQDETPRVIDAEFEVIEPPKRRWSPWPWDYSWYFDWRVFWVVAATSLAGLIARLSGQ